MYKGTYDIIIVGGGHAGCEAAAIAAKMKKKVLLITMNMQTIAQMSCNPAMGGIAKGQIVREVDALGGLSGIISDQTMVQFKMLNKSKGPAMWSPRCQSDRMRFAEMWRMELEKLKNIDFWQDMVVELIVNKNKVCGVKTNMGIEFKSRSVILTNGTFLNGKIHVGEKQFSGGRSGERPSIGLTSQLESFGFVSGRMKTGTPPRIDGRTINYKVLEEDVGENTNTGFSYLNNVNLKKQRSCYIAYTNEDVHKILEKGFEKSPMFQGRIKGIGPRYCPSIEDKITRFKDKNRHQIFLEPEGWDTCEVYVNGFSTSLPESVQYEALTKIKGLENVKMFRPGYAIEYDYFPPTQLEHSLETKLIKSLYFAGQINGTTGYEEAACQGLMAGINACLHIDKKEPLIFKRNEAYIGVLIDDLITKGTEEPYRMFTSRAEFRIILRQDNADLRLTPFAEKIGSACKERKRIFKEKINYLEKLRPIILNGSITPNEINDALSEKGESKISQKTKAFQLLSRPKVNIEDLFETQIFKDFFKINGQHIEAIKQVEIETKYKGYIEKEQINAEKLTRLEKIKIPENFKFEKATSISSEGRQKLTELRPKTIGQASRISGVSPSDISVLLVHLGR
ncbi:MAG: tRNA uridine-5-carboxymethylaminomethyl(34) synthesis enzyme MnmG [Flavobacteriales bacterium]|nr:tRNA uridine-5-carboxymethylaminomethyl(34) synthesis enzyme MnmG [Flavobacteriales bacterium]